ncbi:glycosyltransferase [Amycolatopsis samaneae]
MIFTALGGFGHSFPLIPLAVAARDAGHDVGFATAEDFLPNIGKAGITGISAGVTMTVAFTEAAKGIAEDPEQLPPEQLPQILGRIFGEVVPRSFVTDLESIFAERRPDLVVYESGNVGGAFAAKRAGIPCVGHTFGRMSRMGELGDLIRARIGETAREYGVEGDPQSYFGDPVVDICPESVQAPEFLAGTKRIPLRPVGWSEPGDLPAGIAGRDRSRPLVYLTLGTAFGNTDVLGKAIKGLAVLDADVLVAAGPSVDVAELGEVPANVRLEAWVPQSALLPYVDVVVHHGGSGTTLGSLGAGLPQLVLPQGADQFSNAEMVVDAGVGRQLLGDAVTAEAVTENARVLLTDAAVRDATRALAAEVAAMPGPAEVAATLPSYV